jgi:hypothetical protein
MINIPNAVVGLILLVTGRKIFWLFLGGLGFMIGSLYTQQFLGPQSEYIVMAVGILLGVICALCALFLHQIAVGLGGFIAGGYITLYMLNIRGFEHTQYFWLICLAGGILGTALLAFLFDWAVIFLSSIVGASLIIESIPIPPQYKMWVFLGAICLGGAVQARLMDSDPGKRRIKRLG